MNKLFKERLDYIDLLRLFFCLSVLFYHLGVFKGGFYSVCGFFVISGYLLCRSLDKDDLDLFKHYKKRFIKLYIPLIATVFSVILACRIFDVFWVTMKPEVTSILCGYNNYYQISVGSDYFARSEETPFVHLWYISILLQFELVFPLLFAFFRWVRKKSKSFDASVFVLFLLTASIIYFYVSFAQNDISAAYYGSLERTYSFLFGVFIYLLKKSKINEDQKKVKGLKKAVFFIILVSMAAAMFCIGSDTEYMAELMLLFTVLTAVEMFLACDIGKEDSVFFVPVRLAASVTYEIYLIHYPVIVIWNSFFYGMFTTDLNAIYVFMIVAVIAVFLHALFSVRSRWANPILVLLCVVLGFTTTYGGVLYALEKDHTEEMNALKAQLAEEEVEMQRHQAEYLDKLNDENKKWEEILSIYEDEDYADKKADSVRLCGIGDSVLLGASPALYDTFRDFYCDAVVSRPGLYARDIMADMYYRGILTDAVLLHIGSNGGLWEPQMYDIMDFVNSHDIQLFWVTVTNNRSKDVHCNEGIREMCSIYENAHLIDWEVLSAGHSEWMREDFLHMNMDGAYVYASYVYDAVHGYYRDKFEKERQKVLNEYDESENKKYSFFGGDVIYSLSSGLTESFPEASFVRVDDYPSMKTIAEEEKENGTLARNVVVLLDGSFAIEEKDLLDFKEYLDDRNIYYVTLFSDDYEDFRFPDENRYVCLSEKFSDRKECFHSDRVHLNEKGVYESIEIIKELINKESSD